MMTDEHESSNFNPLNTDAGDYGTPEIEQREGEMNLEGEFEPCSASNGPTAEVTVIEFEEVRNLVEDCTELVEDASRDVNEGVHGDNVERPDETSPSYLDEDANDPQPDPSRHAVVVYVEKFFDSRQIEVLGNGALQRPGDLQSAQSVQEIDRCLLHIDTDVDWVLDELLLEAEVHGFPLKRSSAERAFRYVTRDRRRARKRDVFNRLFQKLTDEELEAAEKSWQLLASICFDGDEHLILHALKHFVFQVKQKALRRAIGHPLMPTIYSSLQGCGKTYFVKRLLAPLEEFCPAPVLLSDLADARSQDIFGFSALLVDDMEQLRPDQVPRFKAMVTNEDFARRLLRTSSFRQRRQMATFIGTSNVPIETLIPDTTGHRRFVTLEFRNGDVSKGGDPLVWQTIRAIDYLALWRSVDAFGPPPIDTIRSRLASRQELNNPHQVIRDWLFNLDFTSEAVANIHVDLGIQPTDLYDLFVEQTGRDETLQLFSRVLTQLTREELCPLKRLKRTAARRYFPVKFNLSKPTA